MTQLKTPGVYIVEEDAFPDSVVEVPTAIPVFIGYTQKAIFGEKNLTNIPAKIHSFAEYQQYFGGGPSLLVGQDKTTGDLVSSTPFLMYRGMKFFYDNGGGDCYIVSVGAYVDSNGKATRPDKTAIAGGIAPLEATLEPTMVLTPDTALMTVTDWGTVAKQVLAHCQMMQSRIAILDLVNGDKKFGQGLAPDPVADFHANVGTNGLSYGAAYYPWLNTNLTQMGDITFLNLSDDVKKSVQKEVEAEAGSATPANTTLKAMAGKITSATTLPDAQTPHLALLSASQSYQATMRAALRAVNVMPPSMAMAGVISATDALIGPWKAPANTSLADVSSPTVDITASDQQSLNVPVNGMAINAIRNFDDRGVLVWGARTLDGNSEDWRYIAVRRTMILIEQSAKMACETFVFAPNDANTWATVKAMLENFLTNMWKQGALMGTKPAEVFRVSVGLGSTMTATDILNGNLNVTIRVAVTHPAEFITFTVKQQMQKTG